MESPELSTGVRLISVEVTRTLYFCPLSPTHLIEHLKKWKITMLTAFFAILLKILGTPALLAALMAFLQKTLHP
jgi:hypothetical protein